MTNDNSGPAFPFTEMHTHNTPYTQWKGMTLRDYFAAQAMIACRNHSNEDWLAARAYEIADAMLKAREA